MGANKNPRKEDSENDLRFNKEGFIKLGLKPIKLEDGLLTEIMDVAKKYKDRCNLEKIICTSVWRKEIPIDYYGSDNPVK